MACPIGNKSHVPKSDLWPLCVLVMCLCVCVSERNEEELTIESWLLYRFEPPQSIHSPHKGSHINTILFPTHMHTRTHTRSPYGRAILPQTHWFAPTAVPRGSNSQDTNSISSHMWCRRLHVKNIGRNVDIFRQLAVKVTGFCCRATQPTVDETLTNVHQSVSVI